MATILDISQIGEPILRAPVQMVANIADPFIQDLIDDMTATSFANDGIGIAAPQVFQPYNIAVIASHPNARYPNAPLIEPFAIINPEILSYSEQTDVVCEGCLSIPGIRGFVRRAIEIEVTYLTRAGKRVTQTHQGMLARIFQHECDHLQGQFYLDQLDSVRDIISASVYQQQLQKDAS